MTNIRWLAVAAFASLAGANVSGSLPAAEATHAQLEPAPADRLTVMTYNVKGLPFPAALDRTRALQQIGLRLSQLRAEGRQPHVIVLQEAFTPEAKSIARLAGYRNLAFGPGPNEPGSRKAMSQSFRRRARALRGEAIGKWADSGLAILSDFPISRTRRHAFAEDACAGFDCLAAKGVVLAWIAVPGQAQPIVIGNTHLNSRKASGVSVERANTAFAEQLAEVRRFVAAEVDPNSNLILAGDFNVGHDPRRQHAARIHGGPVPGSSEALSGQFGNGDLASIQRRGKDKQFYRAGQNSAISLATLDVPLGTANGGSPLSDHLGFTATYELVR